MKKRVIKLVNSLGGTARYSGRNKRMWVTSPPGWDDIKPFSHFVTERFSNLPFDVVED